MPECDCRRPSTPEGVYHEKTCALWLTEADVDLRRERDEARAEAKRLRDELNSWKTIANRWRCCHAGMVAAPDPCPWHGDGDRDDVRLADTGEQS